MLHERSIKRVAKTRATIRHMDTWVFVLEKSSSNHGVDAGGDHENTAGIENRDQRRSNRKYDCSQRLESTEYSHDAEHP
jgi:hypothetical protein